MRALVIIGALVAIACVSWVAALSLAVLVAPFEGWRLGGHA